MALTLDNNLLKAPAYTQSLIVALGMTPCVSELIMRQLSSQPQKLYDYQLLGVQMQAAYLLRN